MTTHLADRERRVAQTMMPHLAGQRRPANRRRRAFTMVEMLVVIAVIGILMGLLVPAIAAIRENARFTRCLNNQGELAKAIAQFESSKKQLPGYVEPIGEFPVSWVVPLLPYLGQRSLYNDWDMWFRRQALRAGQSYALAVHIEQFKCPSDAGTAYAYPLSYVVNCGMQDNFSNNNPPDWPANGVFFNHDPQLKSDRQVMMTSSNIKDGAAFTLLLSENIQARMWTDPYESTQPDRAYPRGLPELGYCKINPPQGAPASWRPPHVEAVIGMVWWADTNAALGTGRRINDRARELGNGWYGYNYARPSSYHTGAVATTFVDTHTKRIRESIEYRVYCQLMSTDDRQVRRPASSGGLGLPADWVKPITESDID